MVRITILGAVSEGAAVATRLARLGHEVELRARNRSSPPSWQRRGRTRTGCHVRPASTWCPMASSERRA